MGSVGVSQGLLIGPFMDRAIDALMVNPRMD